MRYKKPHGFCLQPAKCTMNYCDDNGCQNSKRKYKKGNDYLNDRIQKEVKIKVKIGKTNHL